MKRLSVYHHTHAADISFSQVEDVAEGSVGLHADHLSCPVHAGPGLQVHQPLAELAVETLALPRLDVLVILHGAPLQLPPEGGL